MSDISGRFERAIEEIEGDRAIDIDETYAIIKAAADAGNPSAARLAAIAAGVGYGRSLDLDAAIGWLAAAAERGDESARVQLSFLAGGSGDDWRAVAAGIDLVAWTAARPIRAIHEQPRIGVSEGFIEPRLCAWLIERGTPLQEASLVYESRTGRPVRNDARTNTSCAFKLTDLDMVTILIRQRIANTIGVPVEHFERTGVFRYHTGQTFAEHADYINPALTAEIRAGGQRPFTFIIYLNDAFEGGETHFLAIDRKIRGGVGDALFWRNVGDDGKPDERTMHAGAPPTSGEKWLLSQFIRDKPQLPG